MFSTRRSFLNLTKALGAAVSARMVIAGSSSCQPATPGTSVGGDRPGQPVNIFDFIPGTLWEDARTGGHGFDAAPYVEAAIAIAVGRNVTRIDFHGARLRMDRGVDVPVDRISLQGDGTELQYRGTTGAVFRLVATISDLNLRAGRISTGRIDGFTFIGPGAKADVRAIIMDDNRTTPSNLANVTIEHCFFRDFATDLWLSAGAFCLTVYKCVFMIVSGTRPTTYSVEVEPGNNGGERIDFIACQWANRERMLRQRNANASIFLTNCSLDYSDGNYVEVHGGSVSLSQCHIEGNNDADHWFKLYGKDSILRLSNCVLAQTQQGERARSSPFYADSSATNGGILIRDVDILAPQLWSTPLIGGGGRAQASGLTYYANSTRPPISTFSNLLAHGGFERTAWAAEWTVSDPRHVRRTTAVARSGAASLEIVGMPGVTHEAIFRRPARPGDYISGELYYRTAAIAGSGGTFFVRMAFLDAGGTPIIGTPMMVATEDTPSWLRLALFLANPAPPGTVQCELFVSIFGVIANVPKAFIDDVIVNLA